MAAEKVKDKENNEECFCIFRVVLVIKQYSLVTRTKVSQYIFLNIMKYSKHRDEK
jgi:hypothetical protein